MNNEEDMLAIDQSLADIEWIKSASANYVRLGRQLDELHRTEPPLAADAIEHLVQRRSLERQAEMLRAIVKDPRQFMDAALERLRAANGVETVRVVTPELGTLALRRLAQGYSLGQVAMMIGCTPSTVSSIKSGRYKFSDLPPGAKIGSRGRI